MDDRQDETSPEMDALLGRRMQATKKVAGAEPKDLEAIARWMDGEVAPEEAKRVAARVDGDPEMREVVARLRDAEGERKVVPLTLGARPKKKVLPAIFATVGVLAAAAAVILIARPKTTAPSSELSAGLSGGGLGVVLENGRVKSDGAQAAWIVTREGVSVLPLDEVGGGFVVPDERSWCSWVVVSDWTSDPAADAAKLQGAVTGDKCVIEPADGLRARLPGVTHIGAKKL